MTLSLEGRRALVGGGSQGIGKGSAEELARHGASVTLLARSSATLESARDSLPTPVGQNHGLIAIDFASWEDVRVAAAADVEANGPVAILVNNTGGPSAGPMHEADPDSFAAAFEQHVLVNQALTKVVTPAMADEGYGRIINIISTSVMMPIRGLGVSNTIRAAVANWARTLAAELGGSGITVNNILPGYIDTDRLRATNRRRADLAGVTVEELAASQVASIPVRRLGTPADVGAAVVFLASPEAGYINGVDLPVDGGRMVSLNA